MSTSDLIEKTGFSFLDVVSSSRKQQIVTVRHACMLFLRRKGMTHEAIGKELCRNHSSVCHGVKKAYERIDIKDKDTLFYIKMFKETDHN
jgi:chromosomal replication initiation ATPase DnaA